MRRELIDEAITALRDGRSPLDRAFLVEHRVTSDECYDLAEAMASGLELGLSFTDMAKGRRRR